MCYFARYMTDLALTKQDKLTPLAQKLTVYLTHRLNECRVRNDKKMPQEERDALVAQIKEIKALLRTIADDATAKQLLPDDE